MHPSQDALDKWRSVESVLRWVTEVAFLPVLRALSGAWGIDVGGLRHCGPLPVQLATPNSLVQCLFALQLIDCELG